MCPGLPQGPAPWRACPALTVTGASACLERQWALRQLPGSPQSHTPPALQKDSHSEFSHTESPGSTHAVRRVSAEPLPPHPFLTCPCLAPLSTPP